MQIKVPPLDILKGCHDLSVSYEYIGKEMHGVLRVQGDDIFLTFPAFSIADGPPGVFQFVRDPHEINNEEAAIIASTFKV